MAPIRRVTGHTATRQQLDELLRRPNPRHGTGDALAVLAAQRRHGQTDRQAAASRYGNDLIRRQLGLDGDRSDGEPGTAATTPPGPVEPAPVEQPDPPAAAQTKSARKAALLDRVIHGRPLP